METPDNKGCIASERSGAGRDAGGWTGPLKHCGPQDEPDGKGTLEPVPRTGPRMIRKGPRIDGYSGCD